MCAADVGHTSGCVMLCVLLMLVTSGAAMLGALLMLSHIRLHVVLNVGDIGPFGAVSYKEGLRLLF